jgi:hypothetical protein
LAAPSRLPRDLACLVQTERETFGSTTMKTHRQTRKKRAREAHFDLPHDLVPHPRARQMARASHRSMPAMSVEEIRAKVWHAWGSTIVPGTAILASEQMQCDHYPLYGRPIYADLLKTCKQCARPFLF